MYHVDGNDHDCSKFIFFSVKYEVVVFFISGKLIRKTLTRQGSMLEEDSDCHSSDTNFDSLEMLKKRHLDDKSLNK